MKLVKHNSRNPKDLAIFVPLEYINKANLSAGMEMSYKINEDGSMIITPKKPA